MSSNLSATAQQVTLPFAADPLIAGGAEAQGTALSLSANGYFIAKRA